MSYSFDANEKAFVKRNKCIPKTGLKLKKNA